MRTTLEMIDLNGVHRKFIFSLYIDIEMEVTLVSQHIIYHELFIIIIIGFSLVIITFISYIDFLC